MIRYIALGIRRESDSACSGGYHHRTRKEAENLLQAGNLAMWPIQFIVKVDVPELDPPTPTEMAVERFR